MFDSRGGSAPTGNAGEKPAVQSAVQQLATVTEGAPVIDDDIPFSAGTKTIKKTALHRAVFF